MCDRGKHSIKPGCATLIDSLRERFAGVHINHRRVAGGAAIIGALTIVAKLFVAAREMGIAWRFGISSVVDSYQLSLTITTWVPMMLAGVAPVVLVPRLVALDNRGSDYRAFVAELNGTMLLLGIAISVMTFLVAPAAASLLGSSSNPGLLAMTATMSRQMAVVALFTILVGYLSARLQSRQRFAYSVTEAIPATTIALFAIAPGAASAERLVLGTLTGFFLQSIVLAMMASSEDHVPLRLAFRHRSNEWRSLYGSLFIMVGAQAILALTIPIDQGFAARLGPGAVATLGYANRIVFMATGFGAVVLARALLPVLSQAAAAGDLEIGARHARQWSLMLLALGALASAMIWLMSDWAVALLFQRGSFTAADSRSVAAALRFGALQLPFYFAGLALVQWIAALGRYSLLLIIACAALAMKVLMNFLLVPSLGLAGLMIGSAGMYALSFACQSMVTRRR